MRYRPITKSITDRDNEILTAYFKDVNKIPVMTREEEDEIYQRIIEGDESARERLINGNLRFGISIAKQYIGQGIDIMDLISEANIGIIKASKLFNPTKGSRFLSYAIWWIRESIIKSLIDTSKSVRIPVNRVQMMNTIFKFISKYEQEFETKPSFEEIEEGTGIPAKRVIKLMGISNKSVSIDSNVTSDDDSFTFLDVIPSNEATDQEAIQNNEITRLFNALDSLNIREACILRLVYGINSTQLTLDEIGKKFGISAERVRQIKDRSIWKLRKMMTNE